MRHISGPPLYAICGRACAGGRDKARMTWEWRDGELEGAVEVIEAGMSSK